MDANLQTLDRQLIELRIEHAELDRKIDQAALEQCQCLDELMLRRLKKQRLTLRDRIARLERALEPREPA